MSGESLTREEIDSRFAPIRQVVVNLETGQETDIDPARFDLRGELVAGQDVLIDINSTGTTSALITSTSELMALPEMDLDTYRTLAPHVTALPAGTANEPCHTPSSAPTARS